jgi:hypothetical protein
MWLNLSSEAKRNRDVVFMSVIAHENAIVASLGKNLTVPSCTDCKANPGDDGIESSGKHADIAVWESGTIQSCSADAESIIAKIDHVPKYFEKLTPAPPVRFHPLSR